MSLIFNVSGTQTSEAQSLNQTKPLQVEAYPSQGGGWGASGSVTILVEAGGEMVNVADSDGNVMTFTATGIKGVIPARAGKKFAVDAVGVTGITVEIYETIS